MQANAPDISGPVSETQRVVVLDVLRGVAVLGILAMNIMAFASIDAAYFNPTAYGRFTGIDRVSWIVMHVLADQKFMAIFSLLFGVGIAIMTERATSRGVKVGRLHYRRMTWLLLIGLVHAYVFWYGDILVSYAMTGMIIYPLRRLPTVWLVVLGVAALSLTSMLSVALHFSLDHWPPEQLAEMRTHSWAPTPELIEEQLAAYRGGWWSQMRPRATMAAQLELQAWLFFTLWRTGGLMLLGMAMLRSGLLTAPRGRTPSVLFLAGGLAVGVPIIVLGLQRNIAVDWAFEESFFLGQQFNYWGSLFVALAWIGLVQLLTAAAPRLVGPLAAVGRMALTNYLTQTVICTTIFYGHGFGLFGTLDRAAQLPVVAGVWIAQLLWSPLWLRRYRFGPAEWLWRSLTYGRRMPIRRVTDAAASHAPDADPRSGPFGS